MSTVINAYKFKQTPEDIFVAGKLLAQLVKDVMEDDSNRFRDTPDLLAFLIRDGSYKTTLTFIKNDITGDVFVAPNKDKFTQNLDKSPLLMGFSYDSRAEDFEDLDKESQALVTLISESCDLDTPLTHQGLSIKVSLPLVS